MEVKDAPTWRKSSFSGANGGQCILVGNIPQHVAVKDTKQNGTGAVLRFSPASWRAFIHEIKSTLGIKQAGRT